ncbi:MAG: hypothetical protein E7Z93_01430 [Cyanobacteria bacterium SIG32]|nr:hypothetical protein [Cyanobacteria bacterium SIG32]
MKRNAKIIQISGIKGLITALFVVTCLAAGFVAFPGFVAMNIWNHFAGSTVPEINLYQGILLWAIVALVYFIANKQSFSVSFESPKELNEEEMNALMERIRMQSQAKMLNQMMIKNLQEIQKEDVIKTTEAAEVSENSEVVQKVSEEEPVIK